MGAGAWRAGRSCVLALGCGAVPGGGPHPLLLATGKLIRAVDGMAGHPGQLRHGRDPLRRSLGRGPAVQDQQAGGPAAPEVGRASGELSVGAAGSRGKPHVLGCQVSDAGRTEQAHRPRDLTRKDVRRPVNAPLTAGHEPVQVGASDQDEISAERHAGDDVRTIRHARVDPDLGSVPDLGHDFRKQPQRHWRTVELTSAMVGQQNHVGARVSDQPGIGDGLDSLDDQRAGPHGPEPGEVVDRHGRVEQLVHELGIRSRPRR